MIRPNKKQLLRSFDARAYACPRMSLGVMHSKRLRRIQKQKKGKRR